MKIKIKAENNLVKDRISDRKESKLTAIVIASSVTVLRSIAGDGVDRSGKLSKMPV